MIFKLQCKHCQQFAYKKENTCCENPQISLNVIAGAIVEDSSGVAEADIISFESIRELLQVPFDVEGELIGLVDGKAEVFIKYKDFPESLREHLKNLGPVLKFCIVRIESKKKMKNLEKNQGSLVMLNSLRDDINASMKILKVLDS